MTHSFEAFSLQAVPWLISLSLRGTVAIGVAALACGLVRKRSAALRHAIWCAALGTFVLLPMAQRLVPTWTIPFPMGGIARMQESTPESAGATALGSTTAEPGPEARTSAGRHAFSLPALAMSIWLVPVLVLLARIAVNHMRLARLLRRSCPVDDESWTWALRAALRATHRLQAVPLHTTSELCVPVVIGLFRPRVLLPAKSGHWGQGSRREVLLHEMAHVQRFDLAWLTLGRLLTAMFWFDPLVWVACSRLRVEAERACDDVVLRAGELPSRYAATLVGLASTLVRPAPSDNLAVLRREHLQERVDAILASDRKSFATRRRALIAVSCSALLFAALVASPTLEPTSALESNPGARLDVAGIANRGETPVRVISARVRSRVLVSESSPLQERVRLDAPEIELENIGDRAIGAVRVRLRTPEVSQDEMWRDIHISPHGRAVLRIPADQWSNDAPPSQAQRFEISIANAQFVGEARPDAGEREAPTAPTPKPPAIASLQHPGERMDASGQPAIPTEIETDPQDVAEADRVPARVLNPEGAPIVIVAAWTPRRPPAPSTNETERAMDRGHPLTFIPALVLHNTSPRNVIRVRLRYKADRESHAVSVVDEPIGPGETLRLPPGRSMWGTPEAMTVQVLGVTFADGDIWGSVDSMIDTREGWIR